MRESNHKSSEPLAPRAPSTAGEALGQSEAFLEFLERLSRVASVDRPVLLIGERGTGKELAATRLHYLSSRWQGPFIALNAAALPETLIESELFGHEPGAFTGADRRRAGRFELAHEGTLFLDEIGNIPLSVQEKILRAVEYNTFDRVGGTGAVQTNVRIIGATNADLIALAEQGRFKQDLLDRLSFEVIYLPPLRERKEDILLLTGHFASRMAFELGRSEVPEFTDEAMAKLESYPWPGNIRELKNVIERAVYRSDSNLITEIPINPFQKVPRTSSPPPSPQEKENLPSLIMKHYQDRGLSFQDTLKAVEIELLRQALQEVRFKQKKAAQLMGLRYHQFRGLYRKYKDKFELD